RVALGLSQGTARLHEVYELGGEPSKPGQRAADALGQALELEGRQRQTALQRQQVDALGSRGASGGHGRPFFAQGAMRGKGVTRRAQRSRLQTGAGSTAPVSNWAVGSRGTVQIPCS